MLMVVTAGDCLEPVSEIYKTGVLPELLIWLDG